MISDTSRPLFKSNYSWGSFIFPLRAHAPPVDCSDGCLRKYFFTLTPFSYIPTAPVRRGRHQMRLFPISLIGESRVKVTTGSGISIFLHNVRRRDLSRELSKTESLIRICGRIVFRLRTPYTNCRSRNVGEIDTPR